MFSNPASIIILIFSAVLISVAIFSSTLRLMHKKQVEEIKAEENILNEKEKKQKKKDEYIIIFLIELAFWGLLVLGYIASK